MYQVIIVIHVLLGLGIIGLIMIQQGKGADAGASFGVGASGSVFGSQGAGSFLTRTTGIFATLFFSTSLGLAVLNGAQSGNQDIMAEQPAEKTETPAIPNVDAAKPEQTVPVVPETKIETPVQEPVKAPVSEEKAKSEKPELPAASKESEKKKP